ncbi:hypothetical protein Scep_004744 [Stephania cephalantha]|uniref:Uncharacterized protein n=1 Tax=Stephania cephalantha TaxID=152367 RepID=A0AAP0PWW8_9MAGN
MFDLSQKVKEAMLHAWTSYEKYAWGQDELRVPYSIEVCANHGVRVLGDVGTCYLTLYDTRVNQLLNELKFMKDIVEETWCSNVHSSMPSRYAFDEGCKWGGESPFPAVPLPGGARNPHFLLLRGSARGKILPATRGGGDEEAMCAKLKVDCHTYKLNMSNRYTLSGGCSDALSIGDDGTLQTIFQKLLEAHPPNAMQVHRDASEDMPRDACRRGNRVESDLIIEIVRLIEKVEYLSRVVMDRQADDTPQELSEDLRGVKREFRVVESRFRLGIVRVHLSPISPPATLTAASSAVAARLLVLLIGVVVAAGRPSASSSPARSRSATSLFYACPIFGLQRERTRDNEEREREKERNKEEIREMREWRSSGAEEIGAAQRQVRPGDSRGGGGGEAATRMASAELTGAAASSGGMATGRR